MRSILFETTLLAMLTCTVFPVVLLGAISSDLAQSWNERLALLVSAGIALCLAAIWVAVMLH